MATTCPGWRSGRNDLAGRFDLNAVQIAAAGFLAPVVALEVKFKKPLRFAEEARVLTTHSPVGDGHAGISQPYSRSHRRGGRRRARQSTP